LGTVPSGKPFGGVHRRVSERSNPAGEFYGIGSLKRFVERNRRLDCPDFAGALLNEVRQFGANTPLEDDLTLALARFDAV